VLGAISGFDAARSFAPSRWLQQFSLAISDRSKQRSRPSARRRLRMSTWRNPRGGHPLMTALELCTKSTSFQSRSTSQSMRSRHTPLITRNLSARPHIFAQCRRDAIRTHIQDLAQKRRRFSTKAALSHGHIDPPKPGEELYVTFIDKEGDEHKFAVSKGDNLLDIAQANDLEMEGRRFQRSFPQTALTPSSRSMWRFMRLFHVSCHRGRSRHV
jgi:hypothetical protein